MSMRRVFVLYGFDETTACASRAVAVLGMEHSDGKEHSSLSWVPLEHESAALWRLRLAMNNQPLTGAVDRWLEEANGLTFDLELVVEVARDADLASVVEAVVDRVLASGSGA